VTLESAPTWSTLVDALRAADLLLSAPPFPPGHRFPGLATDSRRVDPGALFLAVPGTRTAGHDHVPDALRRGAAAVVASRDVDCAVPVIRVRDSHRAAVVIARVWHGDPAAGLVLHAVTGTNGKTTTTSILRHLVNAAGDAAVLGTLGATDGAGVIVPGTAALTTPGPLDLQATLAALRSRGCRSVALEASSHSLDQGRLDGLQFTSAVFTNLTRDHLDYHGTMEVYRAAKLRLLELLAPSAVVVVNRDEPAWDGIPAMTPRTPVTFGLTPGADCGATAPVEDALGSRFRLTGRFGSAEVALPIPGAFNMANALAAAAVPLALGVPVTEVAERLGTVPQVPGRMERLSDRPCAILRDYAHTPDALERACAALRPLTAGRLIVLFGCGGDRDRGKRPMMGAVVDRMADVAIVTSDNPRTEDPDRIVDDIMPSVRRIPVVRQVDRRQAIAEALAMARPGDTVLLAGKGHETYQIIGTVSHPFDEQAIVRAMLGGS